MMEKDWREFVKPVKVPILTERIRLTTACGDCGDLPGDPRAGTCCVDEGGKAVQVMHNGLKVLYGGYCGTWVNEIIAELEGVHEPREERIFHEVLKCLEPGATMVEAGCYRGYYSMWFARNVPDARVFLIDPHTVQMTVAKRSFLINGLTGDFTIGHFGTYPEQKTEIQQRRFGALPHFTVQEFMDSKGLDRITLLHSNIQGHEEEMLEGARHLLDARRIDWLFISTHGRRRPACRQILDQAGYCVVAQHGVSQSALADGLLVAQNPDLPEFPKIDILLVDGPAQAHV